MSSPQILRKVICLEGEDGQIPYVLDEHNKTININASTYPLFGNAKIIPGYIAKIYLQSFGQVLHISSVLACQSDDVMQEHALFNGAPNERAINFLEQGELWIMTKEDALKYNLWY